MQIQNTGIEMGFLKDQYSKSTTYYLLSQRKERKRSDDVYSRQQIESHVKIILMTCKLIYGKNKEKNWNLNQYQ